MPSSFICGKDLFLYIISCIYNLILTQILFASFKVFSDKRALKDTLNEMKQINKYINKKRCDNFLRKV
jgi:hypothetical protein